MPVPETPLLNITTLQQLLQLEAKIPNFLQNQLTLLSERWPEYQSALAVVIADSQPLKAADIYHKVKGHAGMLGFHAVQAIAGQLEDDLRSGDSMRQLKSKHEKLIALFQESVKAAETWLRENSER